MTLTKISVFFASIAKKERKEMSLIMLSESLRLSKIYRLETKFFLQIKLTVKLGRKYYSYQLCVYAQLGAVWEKP